MNILRELLNNNTRIPFEYRQNNNIEEIKKDIMEIYEEKITNPHILNLISLLFPKNKKVKSISLNDKRPTMDLEISDKSHSYFANGIPVHNTINIPEDYSFRKFKEVYNEAYKLGCKSLSTFRPNPIRPGIIQDADEKNKIKIKRPQKLQGETTKIKYKPDQEHHLYVTINRDFNDGLYEIFFNTLEEKDNHWLKYIGRLMSSIMRRTDDIQFIIDEGKEIESNDFTWWFDEDINRSVKILSGPHAISYCLEKALKGIKLTKKNKKELEEEYEITDEQIGERCPKCKNNTLVKESGCYICKNCGWSKCE